VVDENKIRVIHKTTPGGVVEEEKCYLPEDVTVLDYTQMSIQWRSGHC
jgi:hypothetical protein